MAELKVIEVDGELIDHREEVDEAVKVQREVQALYKGAQDIFLELAERFHRIQTRKWYIIYGFDSFDEYIQSEAYSRAWVFQLARLHQKYRIELDVPDDRLSEIGVTKLTEMAPHINSKNLEHLLNIADGATVSDLKRELNIIPEIGESSVSPIDSGYYYLTPCHGDIATELTPVSKRFVDIFKDESGALVGKV